MKYLKASLSEMKLTTLLFSRFERLTPSHIGTHHPYLFQGLLRAPCQNAFVMLVGLRGLRS